MSSAGPRRFPRTQLAARTVRPVLEPAPDPPAKKSRGRPAKAESGVCPLATEDDEEGRACGLHASSSGVEPGDAQPKKRGRGRPPGSKNKAAEVASPAEVAVVVVACERGAEEGQGPPAKRARRALPAKARGTGSGTGVSTAGAAAVDERSPAVVSGPPPPPAQQLPAQWRAEQAPLGASSPRPSSQPSKVPATAAEVGVQSPSCAAVRASGAGGACGSGCSPARQAFGGACQAAPAPRAPAVADGFDLDNPDHVDQVRT